MNIILYGGVLFKVFLENVRIGFAVLSFAVLRMLAFILLYYSGAYSAVGRGQDRSENLILSILIIEGVIYIH